MTDTDADTNHDLPVQSTQTWRPSRGVKFKVIAWAILVLIALCLFVTVLGILSGL